MFDDVSQIGFGLSGDGQSGLAVRGWGLCLAVGVISYQLIWKFIVGLFSFNLS